MNRPTIAMGLLSLAAVLAACSSAAASATPATTSPAAPETPSAATSAGPSSGPLTIVAQDFEFAQRKVTVPASKAFELTFDNEDNALHNLAIYTDSSASTMISVGEIFSGPGQKAQSVPALAAGTYFFRCDVHQDMTGTIVAT